LGAWEPQQQVELVRNERYHVEDRPYLDRVVLRVIPDTASLVTQLESGAIDFIAQVSRTDVPRLAANPELDVLAYWVNLYVAVGWNTENPLFADPEVRRALAMAIDRQSIVDTIWGEYGKVGVTPLLTSVWAHDKSLQPLPFDPAEARRTLANKGWKDANGDGVLDKGGRPFSFEITSNAGNQQRNDAAVMIQDQLAKIGVRAQAKVLEFNTLITQTLAGAYDAAIFGFNIDTSLDLSSNFHSRAIDVENNFPRYRNPELDALLDRASAQTDYQAALPIFHRIERILYRDQPVTVLWESQRLTGINRRLRDARPNLIEPLANVDEWWVKPDA
jgi:peptide/nickel transport system substrate-binding protein